METQAGTPSPYGGVQEVINRATAQAERFQMSIARQKEIIDHQKVKILHLEREVARLTEDNARLRKRAL